ncbi:hypothetical protein [Streptomyces sp. NPDC054958]
MDETRETVDRARGRTIREGSAFAALGGTLIGAVAGLGGSVLGFFGAVGSQNAQAEAKRAEIRRAAYVALGESSQAFVAKLSEEGTLMLTKRATGENLKRHYDEKFQPAQVKVVQSELTARLVATEEARALLERVIPHRQHLSTLMATTYVDGSEGTDHEKFADELTKTRDSYQKAMEEFLDTVDNEML